MLADEIDVCTEKEFRIPSRGFSQGISFGPSTSPLSPRCPQQASPSSAVFEPNTSTSLGSWKITAGAPGPTWSRESRLRRARARSTGLLDPLTSSVVIAAPLPRALGTPAARAEAGGLQQGRRPGATAEDEWDLGRLGGSVRGGNACQPGGRPRPEVVGPRLVLGNILRWSEPPLGSGGGWRALEIQVGPRTLNPRAEGARSRI